MTEMVANEAADDAISMSRAIMGALMSRSSCDGEAIEALLPPPFGDMDLETLLLVSSKIGMLATSSASDDSPVRPKEKFYAGVSIEYDITCLEAARVMGAAFRVISDWPKGMESIFSSIADRNPNPHDDHPVHSIFATRAGYRLLGKLKGVDGDVISVIDDALGSWLLRERNIYIDGRQRPKVGYGGDMSIDKADALRRLEGRTGHPLGIRAWVAAGAIEMIGQYVSLASVNKTVDAIARLNRADFDKGMSIEDWSSRFLYHAHYKRSDAIRDVLSGTIRSQRLAGEQKTGLASLQISTDDFLQCTRATASLAKTERRSVTRKAERARKSDGFCRLGQLRALLAARWPESSSLDVTQEPDIRCRTEVRRYYGREMKQNLYSIVDALDLMEARHPLIA